MLQLKKTAMSRNHLLIIILILLFGCNPCDDSITIDNGKIPEKVLKYLWDDAFKFSRDAVFETSLYNSLEDIIRKFKTSRGNERFTIFKEEILNAFLSPENGGNENA